MTESARESPLMKAKRIVRRHTALVLSRRDALLRIIMKIGGLSVIVLLAFERLLGDVGATVFASRGFWVDSDCYGVEGDCL